MIAAAMLDFAATPARMKYHHPPGTSACAHAGSARRSLLDLPPSLTPLLLLPFLCSLPAAFAHA